MRAPARPANEDARLEALRGYAVLDTPPEPAFDALTRLVAHILGVPIALVSLVDADRQWFKARYGLEAPELPRDISFCGHAVALDAVLIVPDTLEDERFADNPLVTGAPRVRFYAGVPLRTSEGFILGTLCAIDQRPREPTPEQLELLALLARHAVDALELRRTGRLAVEKEARLHAVLATAVDAIVTIDDRGRIDRCNAAVERQFGWDARELLGKDIQVLIPTSLRDAYRRDIEAYLRTGEGNIGAMRELLGQRKDGSVFPIDAVVSELWLSGRRLFTGILRDATARKQAERELRETLAAVGRSRDELTQILDALGVCVLVLERDGVIGFVNKAFAALCGTTARQLLGKPWDQILDVSDATLRTVRALGDCASIERTSVTARLGTPAGPRWVELDLRDYPGDSGRQILLLYDVTDVHQLRDQLAKKRYAQIVGESSVMHQLFEQVEQVAGGDWTVLIEGETGSGKELVAHAIHAASSRRDASFVAVNCAGLTDSLLSSQLFGHVKGAFTGAIADHKGLFESASGGTLFLDEIGDTSPTLQAAMLRVLEEKEITRLGETRARKVNTRIIAATHRDLRARVASGQFREDLLYRIRSARVRVPPLRERRQDIPLLAKSFLAQQRVASGKVALEIGDEAMARMVSYHWPGNVRELRAAIEQAVVRCRGRRVEIGDLPSELVEMAQPSGEASGPPGDERARILDALSRTAGNRARAARLLGIGRATLYRRLDELGLDDAGRGEPPPQQRSPSRRR